MVLEKVLKFRPKDFEDITKGVSIILGKAQVIRTLNTMGVCFIKMQ